MSEQNGRENPVRITHVSAIKLAKHIEINRDRASKMTVQGYTAIVSNELGFPISETTVRDIAKECGIIFLYKKRESKVGKFTGMRPIEKLEKGLVELYRRLGEKLPSYLQAEQPEQKEC